MEETNRENNDGANRVVDSVIGLDVGGQLFYTHKSTLTAGSAYFAARFGGSFSAGRSYADERGRDVYFVDANGRAFEYVLDYLRRGIPTWPKDDEVLTKQLVGEAEYFGILPMVDDLLRVYRISPNDSNTGVGILYWLGTKRGAQAKYRNPSVCGEILVSSAEDSSPFEDGSMYDDFFESLPPCWGPGQQDPLGNDCTFLTCSTDNNRKFAFNNILVRPTHYSLRFGGCGGMSDWIFEASVDGEHWDVVHTACKDRHLLRPSAAELKKMQDKVEEGLILEAEDLALYAENHFRHTWAVKSSAYYKHFRFVRRDKEYFRKTYGVECQASVEGETGSDGRPIFSDCLHGVGFEIYGDVRNAYKPASCVWK